MNHYSIHRFGCSLFGTVHSSLEPDLRNGNILKILLQCATPIVSSNEALMQISCNKSCFAHRETA